MALQEAAEDVAFGYFRFVRRRSEVLPPLGSVAPPGPLAWPCLMDFSASLLRSVLDVGPDRLLKEFNELGPDLIARLGGLLLGVLTTYWGVDAADLGGLQRGELE